MLRTWNVAILGALVPLVVAAPGEETARRGKKVEALDYVAELSVAPCKYHCREETCPPDEHDIVIAVYRTHEANHLENCNPGDCDWHLCEPERLGSQLRLATEFVIAVKGAGPQQLRAFLGRYSEQAYYNSERRAIQIIGCNDRLWASIPVRPEIAEALAD
jgi:hypothetical protein